MNRHQPVQLPLELPVDNAVGRDDLVVGEANAVAVEMIDRWPDWPTSVVILAGPSGSGKSHLAAIWAKKARAWTGNAKELANAEGNNIAIEDIGNEGLDETTLFHLINHAREKAGFVLLTSTSWPQSWNITLPDLMSRLRAATLIELKEPDDMLLKMTLTKLFSDRQIKVERNVIDFLVLRMERSINTARLIVERLDQQALATGKPITRPMASRVLEMIEGYQAELNLD